MDCLRSGRDIPVALAGVDPLPTGRLLAEGWPLPKNSRPSKESACLLCLATGSGFFWGGWDAGGSVVLGRAGGVRISSSPKRSTGGCGRLTGGWLEIDGVRWGIRRDVDRSSIALS